MAKEFFQDGSGMVRFVEYLGSYISVIIPLNKTSCHHEKELFRWDKNGLLIFLRNFWDGESFLGIYPIIV